MYVAHTAMFVLVVAVFPSFPKASGNACGQYSIDTTDGQCIDYEWCMYKFYTVSKSWFDAKAICDQNNMALAHITAPSQQTYLYNLMATTLTKLFSSPPSTVWLGAYRSSGGNAKWQDDCTDVDTNYIGDGMEEACFMLDSVSFKSESCSTPQPFVCQESTLNISSCFTSLLQHNAETLSETYAMSELTDCYHRCVINEQCKGIKFTQPECFLYTLTNVINMKYTPYIRDMLRTDVPSVSYASTNRLQDVCSSSDAPNDQISSALSPTTSYMETFSKSTHPLSSVTSVNLETSSSETVPETSSESTPALPSVVTSLNLETTSLPTETVAASCSSCPCIKSSTVDHEELEESISKLKELLKVNPKKLSSYKRKLTSAPDDRQSAANIGYLGVVIICVIPVLIILMDMGRLTREFKKFTLRLRKPHRETATVIPSRNEQPRKITTSL